MKTIGSIGGMNWEGTTPYYQIINEGVEAQPGGLHSAKTILHSVELDEIEKCQSRGDWRKSGKILGKATQGLEAAGADFILICTNTMYKVASQIASMIHIPIIHIADATTEGLLNHSIHKVGSSDTKYTMTQDFYKQKLVGRGIEVIVPEATEIEVINHIIFHESCAGQIKEDSWKRFQSIIERMKSRGAEGVISGRTEIGLLIHQSDSSIPVFDTTCIYAKRVVEIALGNGRMGNC